MLLAVLGVGVFLAGLELMVTAVALPQILTTIADWTDLRKASWIINGYLLVYVVTMPLAGRLTDLWGARRLFLAALTVFTIGSLLAGAGPDLDQLIAARLVQAVGGGAIIPVATAAASHLFEGPARPRALGVIGALTFLGMAAGPFVGAAVLETIHPETALANMGIVGRPAAGDHRAGVALGLLRQRPDRDLRPGHRLGRQRRLGHAPPAGPSRPGRGALLFTLAPRPGSCSGPRSSATRTSSSGCRRRSAVGALISGRRRRRTAGDPLRPAPAATRSWTRASSPTGSSRPRP